MKPFRILDRLLGTPANRELAYAANCYRYLLTSAPPLAIERAHTQAILQLSASDCQRLAQLLRQRLPAAEQWPECELDPRMLAQLATRAELRHPGILERALGAETASPFAERSLFGTMARAFVATPIAQQFLGGIDYDGALTDPRDASNLEQEFDYEKSGYEAPPVEYFVGRSDV